MKKLFSIMAILLILGSSTAVFADGMVVPAVDRRAPAPSRPLLITDAFTVE